MPRITKKLTTLRYIKGSAQVIAGCIALSKSNDRKKNLWKSLRMVVNVHSPIASNCQKDAHFFSNASLIDRSFWPSLIPYPNLCHIADASLHCLFMLAALSEILFTVTCSSSPNTQSFTFLCHLPASHVNPLDSLPSMPPISLALPSSTELE